MKRDIVNEIFYKCNGKKCYPGECENEECEYTTDMEYMADDRQYRINKKKLVFEPIPEERYKWVCDEMYPDKYICSRCRAKFDIWTWEKRMLKYCPNCGVKMKVDENE